ncbi:MAG: S26 family signal peptidase [Dysgonamonadaceae bacterium]|jgi:signal peptidase I|nr:S26 family signal peptidase [Dysgonamonadaceae bacterium]
MRKASKSQWIKFGIVSLIYILFIAWVGNFWWLLLLPVFFDIYISKIVPWGKWKQSKNKSVRKIAEWVDAIVFALVAVYFINIFVFQNYKIPSSSLEKTLLVGDFLFVSKVSYGPRVPNTPLSFPLAQHTLPVINTKSYIEWPQWPYKRLKGFGEVQRYDIVVFNFPAGDTVALNFQDRDFYTLAYQKEREFSHVKNGSQYIRNNPQVFGKVVFRPVDRRENYVKRCVGMPGDSLQVVDNQVYIDGKALENPKKMQLNYFVETTGSHWNEKTFSMFGVSKDDYTYIDENGQRRMAMWEPYWLQRVGITPAGKNQMGQEYFNPVYNIPLTQEALAKLKKSGYAKSIIIEPDFLGGPVYPIRYNTGWTRDNYGPIWIPKKGATIELNEKNIAIYERCIVNYEHNQMKVENGKIFINGEPADSYTFKYDYYWMMGDNRHKSADSRSWGFVPEDHVVGKPILVWLSLDKDHSLFNGGIRWNRLFRFVDNE